MANAFEGMPDLRQFEGPAPASPFRERYRALSERELGLHDAIKAKANELLALYEQVAPGRYRSLGVTALEESVMWTVKGLTGDGLQ